MSPEACAELRQKHYNATVVHLKLVHEDLMVLRIRPDFPVPPHKPGQYSTLGLGQWEVTFDELFPGIQLLLNNRIQHAVQVLDDFVFALPKRGLVGDLKNAAAGIGTFAK